MSRSNRELYDAWDALEDVLLKLQVPDEEIDVLEKDIRTAACQAQGGHEFIDDHCGIPAHRYCSTCFQREDPQAAGHG